MQNIAGVCRLRIPLLAVQGFLMPGSNLTLRHAETLQVSIGPDDPVD